MLFLLAKNRHSGRDDGTTSQTSGPRICGSPALADRSNMQAIAALALGLSAFGLAFCPVGAAFAAAPTAVPAPVATSITTQVADAAPKPRPEHLIETGIATWYGRLHSHRYTVSGERFDPSKLTAAHRSLPIGTIIRVTDEST